MIFVGYQARGTLGYYIKRGEKRIRLLGTQVAVKAKIESIESFSAHADYRGLLNWLKHFSPKPKRIFIVHGEEEAMIPQVASSFEEALAALDSDRDFLKAGGVFTDDVIDAFIELKMEEVTQLRMSTHPVEFDLYYSC